MRETENAGTDAQKERSKRKKKNSKNIIITYELLHNIYFRKTRCGTRILSIKKKKIIKKTRRINREAKGEEICVNRTCLHANAREIERRKECEERKKL